jgi:hypothetical protein
MNLAKADILVHKEESLKTIKFDKTEWHAVRSIIE